jgi:parallel beta-helix repeat protein
VIANNRFTGSTHGDAIEINTPASASTGAHDITITGNLITGYTDASSQTGIGIGVANAHNVAISGNTILNTKLDGIHVEDACKGVTVTGNTIRGAGRSGISINAGAGTTSPFGWVISGNLVEECGKTGGNGGIACEGIVSVRNGTITGNTVVNCGYSAADPYFYGISLGYQSKDIVCSGNYVSGTIGPTASGIGWHDGECFTITGKHLPAPRRHCPEIRDPRRGCPDQCRRLVEHSHAERDGSDGTSRTWTHPLAISST